MPALKKRKISTASSTTSSKEATSPRPEKTNAADAFRKFFESQFQPLDTGAVATTAQQQSESDESDDGTGSDQDFDGFSDESDDDSEDDVSVHEVQVVEHADVKSKDVLLDKQTRKALLSSKVSLLTDPPSSKQTAKPKQAEENASEEADNLKNDLALQRLLKESHLLESASDLNPTGKNRHKAIDLRLQSLGAKNSVFEQPKMPKAQRIGILSKAAKREETRRREARENGIILEKPAFKQKKKAKRRDRGVDAPAVGKFAGGTLRLSKQDVASITGPKKRSKMGKKGRR